MWSLELVTSGSCRRHAETITLHPEICWASTTNIYKQEQILISQRTNIFILWKYFPVRKYYLEVDMFILNKIKTSIVYRPVNIFSVAVKYFPPPLLAAWLYPGGDLAPPQGPSLLPDIPRPHPSPTGTSSIYSYISNIYQYLLTGIYYLQAYVNGWLQALHDTWHPSANRTCSHWKLESLNKLLGCSQLALCPWMSLSKSMR